MHITFNQNAGSGWCQWYMTFQMTPAAGKYWLYLHTLCSLTLVPCNHTVSGLYTGILDSGISVIQFSSCENLQYLSFYLTHLRALVIPKMTWVCLYASFVEFLASPVLSLHLLPRIMQTMKIPTQWHGDTLGNLVWLLWASGAISINKHYIH
jgi:hypothetical protein